MSTRQNLKYAAIAGILVSLTGGNLYADCDGFFDCIGSGIGWVGSEAVSLIGAPVGAMGYLVTEGLEAVGIIDEDSETSAAATSTFGGMMTDSAIIQAVTGSSPEDLTRALMTSEEEKYLDEWTHLYGDGPLNIREKVSALPVNTAGYSTSQQLRRHSSAASVFGESAGITTAGGFGATSVAVYPVRLEPSTSQEVDCSIMSHPDCEPAAPQTTVADEAIDCSVQSHPACGN
ncbi:MAG: hypothetical protein HY747_03055 [Elusimicrobia bacterium]|nr:hypothetical protein [Elusimicrobiota bacterium]